MKNHRTLTALFLAAALTGLIAPLGATDIFKARMLTGRAPIEPAVVNVQIEIESYTTAEEVRALQMVLNQGDFDAFVSAFSQYNKGTARFKYTRGFNLPIHAAISTPTETGKKVLAFFNRQNYKVEAATRVGRFRFMVMELEINLKGKGSGRFYEDALINLDPNLGTITLESYESAPVIFPSVVEVVKKDPAKK